MKVFVYGTLMRDEFNHCVLNGQGVEYLGTGITKEDLLFIVLALFREWCLEDQMLLSVRFTKLTTLLLCNLMALNHIRIL